MSDDEDEYDYDEDAMDDEQGGDNDEEEEDDEEQEEFEYTDEEEEADDAKVALENAYYHAKSLRDNPIEATRAFEQVIRDETTSGTTGTGTEGITTTGEPSAMAGQWTFKSLKQLVKLQLMKTGNATELLRHYRRLLGCVASEHVSPNAVEKGVSGMLERISSLYQGAGPAVVAVANMKKMGGGGTTTTTGTLFADPQGLALEVYNCTLQVFHPKSGTFPNERLWFKTNLKYGQLLYERNETQKLQAVLKDLMVHHSRGGGGAGNASGGMQGGGSGSSSGSSSTTQQQSLEIYALQIQLYSRQKDHKRLRETYSTAMNVVAGSLPHPRTLALIQELGGKMHMAAKEYGSAEKSFFQAFKSYDEAGDISRLRCLKYLVLASMLHASTINPFDSQEARPYRDDPEIVAMTNLVQAFHANDIAQFEKILKTKKTLLQDDFVREHMEDLLRTIRRQVLKHVLKPYSRISLQAIATQFLNDISVQDVESLLVGLILDNLLDAKLDRVDGILYNNYSRRGQRQSKTSTSGGGMMEQPDAALSSASSTREKLQAVESLMDLLSNMNGELAQTMSNPSSSGAAMGHPASGSRRGSGSGSAGMLMRGTGMVLH